MNDVSNSNAIRSATAQMSNMSISNKENMTAAKLNQEKVIKFTIFNFF